MPFTFDTSRVRVMGILNVTPDSFSDGGRYSDPELALRRVLEMQEQGADYLDIGAQSTRPGFEPVPPEEELRRLLPVLGLLQGKITIPISVDTFSPEVALEALKHGASIINDVSGAANPAMAEAVALYGAGWIRMHNGEVSEDDDPVILVRSALKQLLEQALGYGLRREQLCLDPGIGFGKSMEANLRLLANTQAVRVPGVACMVGASRKRVVDFAIGGGTEPGDRLGGSIAAHTLAALSGADIIRAHDVKETVQAARLAERARHTQIGEPKQLTTTCGACTIYQGKQGRFRVDGLELFAYHGCDPEERRNGQVFLLDMELKADFSLACAQDDLEDTVNYAGVIELVEQVFVGDPCNLIEHAAYRTASVILQEYPTLESVKIRVHKPDAPIRRTVSDISFELELDREGLVP